MKMGLFLRLLEAGLAEIWRAFWWLFGLERGAFSMLSDVNFGGLVGSGTSSISL